MEVGKEKGFVLYDEMNDLLTDFPPGREFEDLLVSELVSPEGRRRTWLTDLPSGQPDTRTGRDVRVAAQPENWAPLALSGRLCLPMWHPVAHHPQRVAAH